MSLGSKMKVMLSLFKFICLAVCSCTFTAELGERIQMLRQVSERIVQGLFNIHEVCRKI